MAQKEYFNYMGFGGDDYFDKCNKDNFYYNDKDYKLKRYKARDSIIVRDTDENGRIVDIILDIGLSHHQHGVTQDLSSDRLWLNKIDNPRRRINDMREVAYDAPLDNLSANDFLNRIYRISKLVDRDVFHEQLGFIDMDQRTHHHHHYPYGYYKIKRRRGE